MQIPNGLSVFRICAIPVIMFFLLTGFPYGFMIAAVIFTIAALTDTLDAALVDDALVLHGVTAVEPVDPSRPAFRDVLVLTYKKV